MFSPFFRTFFFVLFLLSMTLPKPSEEVETLKIGLIASENNNVFESDGSSSSDATPANVEKPKLPEPPKLEEIRGRKPKLKQDRGKWKRGRNKKAELSRFKENDFQTEIRKSFCEYGAF